MLGKRFISASILGIFFILLLWFSNIPYLLNIVVAYLSAAAVYEALVATKYIEGKSLMIISMVFASIMPFLTQFNRLNITVGIFVFTVILFLTLFFTYGNFTFEHISVVFLISIIISFFFLTIIFVRWMDKGEYYIYYVFVGAWISDLSAYTFGRLFGKHKLIEKISPKKTVEGAAGAVVSTGVFFFITSLIIAYFFHKKVDFVPLVIAGFLASVAAQIGDLSASIIKRTFGVKDFGSILPGHGGILDRFDSVIFVSPFLFILFSVFPMIH